MLLEVNDDDVVVEDVSDEADVVKFVESGSCLTSTLGGVKTFRTDGRKIFEGDADVDVIVGDVDDVAGVDDA